METAPSDLGDLSGLIRRAAGGDPDAWRAVMARFHPRLRRMVALRLDSRLSGRLDPSDVLQETYIDAVNQLPEYVLDPKIPFFFWLRLLAGHRLAKLHRFHLGAQARDVTREVSLFHGNLPEASSAALAAQLLGQSVTPGEAAAYAEMRARLQDALNRMDATDREVLSLRHFEQLTTPEAAAVLGITAAAGKRYVRALAKLKDVLAGPAAGWASCTRRCRRRSAGRSH